MLQVLIPLILTPLLVSSQTITYSFSTGEFDKIFPFDKHYQIKFTDIEPTVNLIEIKIWNTSKMQKAQKDVLKALKSQSQIKATGVSNHTLLGDSAIPPPFYNWTRTINTNGTQRTAVIGFAHKLKPNNSYFVEIFASKVDSLNDSQEAALKNALKNSPEIEQLAQELIATKRNNTPLSLDFISDDFKPKLEIYTQNALNSLNPNYKMITSNSQEFSSRMRNAKISLSIDDIHNIINDLKRLTKNSFNKKLNSEIAKIDLEKLLSSIDIAKLDKESDDYNKIINSYKEAAKKAQKEEVFKKDSTALIALIEEIIDNKDNLIDLMLEKIVLTSIGYSTTINQNYHADIVKVSKNYVFANVGFGFFGKPPNVNHFTQGGMSIYLRPVNESIPFKHYTGCDKWLVRTSIMVGVTVTGGLKTDTRKGIITDSQAILLGLGYRLIPNVEINVGGIFYYDYPSPLVDRKNQRVLPFISATADFKFNFK